MKTLADIVDALAGLMKEYEDIDLNPTEDPKIDRVLGLASKLREYQYMLGHDHTLTGYQVESVDHITEFETYAEALSWFNGMVELHPHKVWQLKKVVYVVWLADVDDDRVAYLSSTIEEQYRPTNVSREELPF